MPSCSAVDCEKRNGSKSDYSDSKVSLHRIPTRNRSQWLHHINRRNVEDLEELRICSDHFDEGSFKRDLKGELTGKKSKPELKEDAVPTIFSHKKKVIKRKSSLKRIQDKEKRQLVDDLLSSGSSVSETINITDECDNVLSSTFINNDDNEFDLISETSAGTSQDLENTFLSCKSQLYYTTTTDDDITSGPSYSAVDLHHRSTQTELSFPPLNDINFYVKSPRRLDPNDSDDEVNDASESSQDEMDESYIPSSQDSQNSTDRRDDKKTRENEADVKLIIAWSCLVKLLSFCHLCKSEAMIKSVKYFGFAVSVTLMCTFGHETSWSSMPKIDKMFSLNLLLPAAILFSGSRFTEFKDICDIIGIRRIGKSRFNKMQSLYLFPAIHNIYKKFRGDIINDINEKDSAVDLSGDARCDSPGYSAKYSTYSLMDTVTNYILHFHVTHVSHVGNSARMEKAGLVSVLKKVESMSVKVKSIVTDRHQGVTKYLREEKKSIIHQFDIWHFTKNIKKALLKAAKKKDCEIINDWVKAIINHFWWCCKTCGGSEEVLRERWTSLMFHISNKHRWVGYKHFKRCEHKKLSKREMKKKLWVKEGTAAYIAIEKNFKKQKNFERLKTLHKIHA